MSQVRCRSCTPCFFPISAASMSFLRAVQLVSLLCDRFMYVCVSFWPAKQIVWACSVCLTFWSTIDYYLCCQHRSPIVKLCEFLNLEFFSCDHLTLARVHLRVIILDWLPACLNLRFSRWWWWQYVVSRPSMLRTSWLSLLNSCNFDRTMTWTERSTRFESLFSTGHWRVWL